MVLHEHHMTQVLIDIGRERDRLITEKLEELKRKGYEVELRREADCLYCPGTRLRIYPDEFEADSSIYFEDASNPNEDRMLFAISLLHGEKGFLIETCSVYMDNISTEMLNKLKRVI